LKDIYFLLSSDTDPDFNPNFFRASDIHDLEGMWQGVITGIATFRDALSKSTFTSRHGQPCITWLLRADRQIAEIYGDASFCYRHFERIWNRELEIGSEIGWHPHLIRRKDASKSWDPWLGQDDDLKMLEYCFHSLRHHVDIKSVRTGWDYHSNNLMKLFNDLGLLVDASAIPGDVQTDLYNWEGTPCYPYYPSSADYRRPANDNESSLNIIEIPVLVERLSLRFHLARYFIRTFRGLKTLRFNNYESARWRGVIITRSPGSFVRAVKQAFELAVDKDNYIISTFFHPSELISTVTLKNLLRNLETLSEMTESAMYNLIPLTLGKVVNIAKASIA